MTAPFRSGSQDPSFFLLDANVFIEAKRRYYAFCLCPGFWRFLEAMTDTGRICSVDRVAVELKAGRDDLAEWAVRSSSAPLFSSTDQEDVVAAYAALMQWAQKHPHFRPEAKSEFAGADNADAWLIAYAVAKGGTIVTQEQYDPHTRKRVKIPNACRAFHLPYVNTFEMLTRLSAVFTWTPPTRCV